MKELPRVILWAPPRSVSTAFERSIRELPKGQIFHELFAQASYLGPDRPFGKNAMEDVPAHNDKTFDKVLSLLGDDYPGKDFMFCKDMAYCAENYLQELVYGDLNLKHTFLIRHPAKSIPSMYKTSLISDLWGGFNENEVGFLPLYKFYCAVKEIDDQIVIVDADDLLANPNGIMEAYCQATGLPYHPEMTSWKPGPVDDWAVWGNGWMDEVEKTSGFKPPPSSQKSTALLLSECASLPNSVQKLIQHSMIIYEEMYQARLHL